MGAVRFEYGGISRIGVGSRSNQSVLPWEGKADGRLRVSVGGCKRGGGAARRGVEAVRVRVGLLPRTIQVLKRRHLHPQTQTKRLRSSPNQRQKPPHSPTHRDRVRPPQAGRPGYRGPHQRQPVKQPPGEPALGEPEREDPVLVLNEREPRVERPEAVEAGGGARARGGGVGVVRFEYGGRADFGVAFWEHQ